MAAAGQAVFAFSPEHGPLDLPDLRPLVRVLYAIPLPRLLSKDGRIGRQILHFAGRTATRQPRILLFLTAAFLALFPAQTQDSGLLHPAVEVSRNLAHEHLLPLLQTIEKLAVATVQLVECPGSHANPIA